MVQGVYSMCPYIAGPADYHAKSTISMLENQGYFTSTEQLAILAKIYVREGDDATDPLAWPRYASIDDLRGLPPHCISVNELDPLRDEGLDFFHKLVAAG